MTIQEGPAGQAGPTWQPAAGRSGTWLLTLETQQGG
jgi:hypothetical protein